MRCIRILAIAPFTLSFVVLVFAAPAGPFADRMHTPDGRNSRYFKTRVDYSSSRVCFAGHLWWICLRGRRRAGVVVGCAASLVVLPVVVHVFLGWYVSEGVRVGSVTAKKKAWQPCSPFEREKYVCGLDRCGLRGRKCVFVLVANLPR